MDPRISIVTLGVTELERSVRFYRDGLGLPMQEREDGTDIAFFAMPGAWLALYPRELLAEDAQVPSEGSGFTGIALAHNVDSEERADEVLAEAERAGAGIVKPARETDWGGYSGYFADPDGYLWEVAHNPFFPIE